MEFKLELMVRDLGTLASSLGNGSYVKNIEYVDKEKKSGIDGMVATIGVDNAQAAFRLGMRYQQKMKPLTEDELNEMEMRFERENDL